MDFPRQKELFDKQKAFLSKRSLKIGGENSSLQSPEKILFLLIGIFLLLILTFCLGIEKGKRVFQGYVESKKSTGRNIKTIVVESPKQDLKTAVYTIQLATYKKQKYANQELNKLKEHNAWVERQGNMWVIYSGKFKTQKEAKEVLAKIKKQNRYKDAFLRKVAGCL